MMMESKERTKLANDLYHLLQRANWNAGMPFRLSDALVDDTGDNTVLRLSINQTSSYTYKFFVSYDYGSDTFSTRFGYMDCGDKIDREDWCEFYVTDWSHDVYIESLFTSLSVDWDNRRDKSLFHNIADEAKKAQPEEESPADEDSDYIEMLRFAGWID
jgi:hypothetical protein